MAAAAHCAVGRYRFRSWVGISVGLRSELGVFVSLSVDQRFVFGVNGGDDLGPGGRLERRLP